MILDGPQINPAYLGLQRHSNYRRAEFAALGFLFIGILFKLQSWEATSIILTGSYLTIALLCLTTGYRLHYLKQYLTKSLFNAIIIGGVGAACIVVSLYLRLNSYPYVPYFTVSGAVLLIPAVVIIYIQPVEPKSIAEIIKKAFLRRWGTLALIASLNLAAAVSMLLNG